MSIDFEKLCNDFRIDTAPRNHPHYRYGWINIECPFCSGHKGYHLGYSISGDFFTCYRCGWHPTEKVISAIAKISIYQANELLKKYSGKADIKYQKNNDIVRPEEISFPSGTAPMTERHKKYLSDRKFDPDKLEKLWGLLGTDHTGPYRFRIIVPITFNGKVVSYQGRDITDLQHAKYKACSDENEVIPHKHILYGWDEVPYNQKTCLVVEGVTGVWRFGPGALATFGVKYTSSQIRLISKRFDKIYTLYDPDEAGNQAESIVSKLKAMGKEAKQLEFMYDEIDSGNISQDIADYLMKEILR